MELREAGLEWELGNGVGIVMDDSMRDFLLSTLHRIYILKESRGS